MASWEETKKLAAEINWAPENMYAYFLAQIDPEIDLIIEDLRKSGEVDLANRLYQFTIDAAYADWSDAQIELVINDESREAQKSAQPCDPSRVAILYEVLPHVRSLDLKAVLQELIDGLPPIEASITPKPPEPFI